MLNYSFVIWTFIIILILVITRCADHLGNGQYVKKCVLPFIDTTGSYNDCTTVGDSTAWCSTLTDANNVHIPGNWGICAPPEDQGCFKGKKKLSYAKLLTTKLDFS